MSEIGQQIKAYLDKGMSVKEIARALYIPESCVEGILKTEFDPSFSFQVRKRVMKQRRSKEEIAFDKYSKNKTNAFRIS